MRSSILKPDSEVPVEAQGRNEEIAANPAHGILHGPLLVAGGRVAELRLEAVVNLQAAEVLRQHARMILHVVDVVHLVNLAGRHQLGDRSAHVVEADAQRYAADAVEHELDAVRQALEVLSGKHHGHAVVRVREGQDEEDEPAGLAMEENVDLAEVELSRSGCVLKADGEGVLPIQIELLPGRTHQPFNRSDRRDGSIRKLEILAPLKEDAVDALRRETLLGIGDGGLPMKEILDGRDERLGRRVPLHLDGLGDLNGPGRVLADRFTVNPELSGDSGDREAGTMNEFVDMIDLVHV